MPSSPLMFSVLGTSFPADQYIEDKIKALGLFEIVPFRDVLARHNLSAAGSTNDQRMASLHAEILARPGGRAVVMGRSSGGIVATRLAVEYPELLDAIVVLGYPFRRPGRHDEPDRYTHLAALRTPTLILQGTEDSYGTLSQFPQIELSPKIRYCEIATNHEFSRPAPNWQRIGEIVAAFLGRL